MSGFGRIHFDYDQRVPATDLTVVGRYDGSANACCVHHSIQRLALLTEGAVQRHDLTFTFPLQPLAHQSLTCLQLFTFRHHLNTFGKEFALSIV